MAPRVVLIVADGAPVDVDVRQAYAGFCHAFDCAFLDEASDVHGGARVLAYRKAIAEADVVFVEVSGDSPDAYFMIGFAHALRKRLFVVASRLQAVHFNASMASTIRYQDGAELRHKLTIAMQRVLQGLSESQAGLVDSLKLGQGVALLSGASAVAVVVAAWTLEELRERLNVRLVEALESGRTLSELPRGVTGYAYGATLDLVLHNYRERAARLHLGHSLHSLEHLDIILSAEGGMAHVEIASTHADVYLICSADVETTEKLQRGRDELPGNVSVFSTCDADGDLGFWGSRLRTTVGVGRVQVVAIPVLWVLEVRLRATPGGAVLDLTFQLN